MFCTGCGSAVAQGAKFCVACGAAIGTAPVPEAARHGSLFKLSLQGVDERITRATGDYDSIDIPEPLDAGGLEQLLRQLQGLRVREPSAEEDFCPPHVVVEIGKEMFQFHVEDGALVSAQTGSPVSIEQAMQLVTGVVAKEALRPRHAYPRGMQPLKKPELAPTFWEDLSAGDIDTGPASPQLSQVVWKGPGWLLMSMGPLVLGAVILALTLAVAAGGVSKRDQGGVVLGIVLGAGMIGAGFVARVAGRAALRVGVDWKTNTLWFVHEGKTGFEPNANCIRDLLAERHEWGNRFSTGNPVLGRKAHEAWQLNVVYADGFTTLSSYPSLASGDDARAVARLAMQLIASA